LLVGVMATVAACSRQSPPKATLPTGAIVDLAHDYSDQTIFWPTAEGFRLDKVADGMTDKGYYYAANNYSGAEHGGTNERGAAAVPKLHFPGLHPGAARWLAETRRISAVGLDTASIDYGQSTLFEAHRALYEHNVPAFENLTNLDRLPPRGAVVIALPMKIKGGSGAPLRAVAILPPTQ
jgi:kynurenine formamidase